MSEKNEHFIDNEIDECSTPNRNIKSPSSKKEIFEINDDIAKKLLESKFYLSALEFHTELVENGKELPRLKEFFSNPANFEIQMKLDPFHSFRKTASCLTLDSIDDLTRYSDDGQHETDEKVTILEFELRKAKETIHELRENITKMTSDNEVKKNTVKGMEEVNGGFDLPVNRYEIRTLNFLVNKYLLKRDYKLTSITFAEEVGDQDVDDWEDVGLNTGEPPDILHLLRDFSKHVSSNGNAKEIESLQQEIELLTVKCEKMDKEMVQADERRNTLLADDRDISDKRFPAIFSERSTSSPTAAISEDKSLDDLTSLNSEDLLNVDTMDNSQEISNNSSCDELSIDIYDNMQDSNSNKLSVQSTPEHEHNIVTKENGNENDANDEEETYDLHITNELLPEQFLRTLYAQTCKKGISRLSTQMSTEEDRSPVEVITLALPNIIPNILLSKREEVIPLILCAVRYHEDSKTRDELLNMLFNLIKRPDSEQRRIIIDGCLSFATKVESSRIECELLPQCWEQINHKFAERRLLVSETCGSLSPCIPPSLLSSLVFSMLGQMLEEESNEEVRTSVIKNLSVIITYMIESGKYMQAYAMLERSLNDIIPDVIVETKNYLLPVVGLWAMKINKLRSHLIPRLFAKCFESLQTWHEEKMANIDMGDGSSAILFSSENKFKTYIDCLINLCTVMFCDCLLNAPFSNEILDASNTDKLNIENKNVSIDNSRIPVMKNPLFNLDSLIGEREKAEHLVYKFDEYFKNGGDNWNDIDWICAECVTKICEMCGLIFSNYNAMEIIVTYMMTICRIFGKQYTLRKIVPFFETSMRNTGAAFLRDVPPVCSPLLVIFLCGVLANFDGEEEVKKLVIFIKQCLLTISTQNLSKDYLIFSITTLCRKEALQGPVLLMLRETLVYPVSEVKMATSVILGVLVKTVSKEILSTQVAPAIITLSTDRDMNVIIAAVPALGSVIESISDRNLLDKVILQIQTLLEDREYKNHIPLQKIIIKTFTKMVPNLESRLRDDFFVPRLKTIAESNHSVSDVTDRLEVAEELIAALSATLCCFLSKDIIGNFIIPTLKHLESELKDISPETMDIVVLLLKDAESKIDDDKNSSGSGSSNTSTSISTTSSKLFGGLSSRFDKFKKKPKDNDRSPPAAAN